METAQFGMGCFWGPHYFFSKVNGVTKTVVGYAGGESTDPTYHDLDSHTETIQITFDPSVISYAKLLDYYFSEHDATLENKTQYKSIIFFTTPEQKAVAESRILAEQEKRGEPILTEVLPATSFFPAEDYHQHYIAKQRGEYHEA